MGSSSKESENTLLFSLMLEKISNRLGASSVSEKFRKLKRFLLSCEEGKRRLSMKLAVPLLKRNTIAPRSDDRLFSFLASAASFPRRVEILFILFLDFPDLSPPSSRGVVAFMFIDARDRLVGTFLILATL